MNIKSHTLLYILIIVCRLFSFLAISYGRKYQLLDTCPFEPVKVIISYTFIVRFMFLVCFLYSTISLVSISRFKSLSSP